MISGFNDLHIKHIHYDQWTYIRSTYIMISGLNNLHRKRIHYDQSMVESAQGICHIMHWDKPVYTDIFIMYLYANSWLYIF